METAIKGHLLAFFTILCWGTTFISTKILLADFSPIMILLTRFAIALTILSIIRPKPLKLRFEEHRLYLVLAGLAGVTLYYLLENIALTYTEASNVGIIVATSPLFAAILASFTLRRHILNGPFILGFIIAMSGVILIDFAGRSININPLGDILALGASAVWAVYAVLMKKICAFGYDMVAVTRDIFLYGVILMIPAIIYMGIDVDMIALAKPINMANMLYLGIGASAICFLTWNLATKYLGVIKTTVYIYASPVITVTMAYFILGEPLTIYKIIGMVLAILGLVISQK